ncbi:MAG: hypothetical protein KGJ78_13980 [Alphaproteobacteria bacterium]|nr:hypothetical protein [Alphaproteobacteria bacterium]
MSGGSEGGVSDAALRLLQGVARELRALAGETAEVGEALSVSKPATSTHDLKLLQKFDSFCQSLHAHAMLIADLAMQLDRSVPAPADLHALVENVPFSAIRKRMRADIDGTVQGQLLHPDDLAEEHWF